MAFCLPSWRYLLAAKESGVSEQYTKLKLWSCTAHTHAVVAWYLLCVHSA